jgi:hypothetical protein
LPGFNNQRVRCSSARFGYVIVNDKRVLVNPKTRTVVEIVQ